MTHSGRSDIPERTFRFAVRILRLCRYLEKRSIASDRLVSQLLASGTSIGANVEEAQVGQSRKDFCSKNAIALKEARETIYWLWLLVASHLVPEHLMTGLVTEAREIAAILGKVVISTRANDAGGRSSSDE
ncbi:MAG: CHP02436-containing protein [Phycisphaerales bacterium]|nr:CHP02436-containing protein [Phycisphaerales bacterium]